MLINYQQRVTQNKVNSMKHNKSILLLACGLMFATASLPEYFYSPAFKFEITTGGQYLGEIPEEIRGVKAHKFVTPTDKYYSTQKNYSMSNIGDIESTWDKYTGKGTTIAVIDDGFDHDHPEYTRSDGTSILSDASAYFYSTTYSYGVTYYKNDETCLDEDWDSDNNEWSTHGTNTSTTAAAPMNNDGIVGVAPEATILALKIDMSFVAIEAAIKYAISQKVDVINMSLGAYASSFTDGFGDKQTGESSVATYLNSVCKSAYDNGIIVVAAAGNEATYQKSYPACNTKVIGVGALEENSDDTLAAFTNYVSSSQTGEVNVDILAPGYVYAAGIGGSGKSSHYSNYHNTQGTSFSSPIVAAAAALWKQKYPNGTPDEFLEDLQGTADGIGEYKNKYVPVSYYGDDYKDVGPSNIENGRLNVYSLLFKSNEITGISLSTNSISLNYQGGTTSSSLTATIKPKNADNKTINWSVSDSNVVSLSSNTSLSGEEITITAKGIGEAIITASTFDNSFSETCKVNVSQYISISSISLKDINGNVTSEITKGDTLQLYPSILPDNASNQDYIVESENTSIATIDNTYLVKGVSVGETDITMIVEDGDNYLESKYHVVVNKVEGLGEIVINMYDSTTLSNTSSTTGLNLNSFKDKVSVDGTTNNNVLSSYEGSTTYLRKGGIALSTGKTNGNFTIKTNDDYKIYDVDVIGAFWDSDGVLKLNSSSGTGSLNASGTALENCSNTLSFNDLNGTNELKFSSTNRTVIYKIVCSYALPKAIQAESLTISPSSLTLDLVKTKTGSISATVLPNNTTNATLNYVSSNENVATINNNGLVSAVSVGKATITVSTTDGSNLSKTCEVIVNEGQKVVSLSLSVEDTSCPYMSTFDTSKINAKATYNDGTIIDVSSKVMYSKIDSSILGMAELTGTYTENGIMVSDKLEIKVTNKGAENNVGKSTIDTSEKEETTTFINKSWSDANNNWESGKDGNQYLNNGVQITKDYSGAYATSKKEYYNVSKVVVNYCTNASKGAGTIEITIGNNDVHSFTVSSTGGTTSREATFTLSTKESGKINLCVACTTNSIYIQSITIISNISEETSNYLATPLDQAKAWATYFLNQVRPSCDETGLNSDVTTIASKWTELANEYQYMINDSKSEFVNSSDSTIIEARNLYQLIYSKYQESLSNNDFVDDGNGTKITQNSLNHSNFSETMSPNMLFGIILMISQFILLFVFLKRRKNSIN